MKKIIKKYPKIRILLYHLLNLISFIGNIFCVMSLILLFSSILLVLFYKVKILDFMENEIIKSAIFGLFSLLITPIILWSIKNRKEIKQKIFFENQDIFENLIREISLIYVAASNRFVNANNLCEYIENNSGKFFAFIPNNVLENIDLLIRECNQYADKNFDNIKYYANKSISSLRRFAGTSYFSFATYDIFHCEHK